MVVHIGQSPVVCHTWYGPGRTGLKVLHPMDCASHPSNMHLVKALLHPTQMEGFVWSSYLYMTLQMYIIHVGDRCNSYGVFIWLSCVCVIIVERSRRAGINRMYIVAAQRLCGHLFN